MNSITYKITRLSKACEKTVHVCFDHKAYTASLTKTTMICNIVWFSNFSRILHRLMTRLALLLFAISKMNFALTLNFVEAVIREPFCYLVNCH